MHKSTLRSSTLMDRYPGFFVLMLVIVLAIGSISPQPSPALHPAACTAYGSVHRYHTRYMRYPYVVVSQDGKSRERHSPEWQLFETPIDRSALPEDQKARTGTTTTTVQEPRRHPASGVWWF